MDTDPVHSPDEEAFLRQFMAGERAMLRFILRDVSAVTDAGDVLKETLVTLWAKRAEFDATSEFRPWACGIAPFKVREFWRAQPRREAFADDDLIALIDARREVLEPEISARGEKLRECLAKLPAEQRDTLHRDYAEEESVETLALREGRSAEAIYKLLQPLRRALLECIQRGLRAQGATS